jgi:hypothetical protein
MPTARTCRVVLLLSVEELAALTTLAERDAVPPATAARTIVVRALPKTVATMSPQAPTHAPPRQARKRLYYWEKATRSAAKRCWRLGAKGEGVDCKSWDPPIPQENWCPTCKPGPEA